MSANRAKPKSILTNFVKKLYNILNDCRNSDVISWVNDGMGFCILDQDSFVKVILANYYRHSNIASFIRQLNMYGFRKVKENDRQYYVHPMFLRDEPHLVQTISRKPQKKLLTEYSTAEKEPQDLVADEVEPLQAHRSKPKKRAKRVQFKEAEIGGEQNRGEGKWSLANIMNKSQGTIFQQYDNSDRYSICENLSQRSSNHNEFMNQNGVQNYTVSIKSNVIFWSPSVIMHDEDL